MNSIQDFFIYIDKFYIGVLAGIYINSS